MDYDSQNRRWVPLKELPAGQQFIQVYNLTQALEEKPKFVWLSLIGRTIILNWNICIRNLFSSCLVGKLFYFAERRNAAPASLSAGMFSSGVSGLRSLIL